MTLLVAESALTVEFSVNIPMLDLGTGYVFTITSQYSHEDVEINAEAVLSNARYTTFEVTFPDGFGDSHKNGIYNYDISLNAYSLTKGLVKIITEPGGGMGTTNYTSTPNAENRVSTTYFRPNY